MADGGGAATRPLKALRPALTGGRRVGATLIDRLQLAALPPGRLLGVGRRRRLPGDGSVAQARCRAASAAGGGASDVGTSACLCQLAGRYEKDPGRDADGAFFHSEAAARRRRASAPREPGVFGCCWY